jgi:hypothetical protein
MISIRSIFAKVLLLLRIYGRLPNDIDKACLIAITADRSLHFGNQVIGGGFPTELRSAL